MGFSFGKALGKIAGKVIGKASGGLINPKINFSKTSARPGTPYSNGGAPSFSKVMVNTKGSVCPPGQACHGASYGDLCLGTCVPTGAGGGGGGGGGGTGIMPYPGGGDIQAMMAYCMAQSRGKQFKVPSPCPGFHWNTGRYHVYGDCRRGTGEGDVAPYSKLVRNRRINPANGKAAMHALRRVSATHHLLVTLDKHLQKVARRAVHHGGAKARSHSVAKTGCGCK